MAKPEKKPVKFSDAPPCTPPDPRVPPENDITGDRLERMMREIDEMNDRIGKIEKAQGSIVDGLNKISWHLFRRKAVD